MKLNSWIVMRPFSFFIVPSMVVLVLSSLLVSFWLIKVSIIENQVKLISNNIHQEILSGLEDAARILIPTSSSATNLTKVLSPSFAKTELSFSSIKTKVAPTLFQALSTIPYLSQISYIGMDGLFFSFYYARNQQLSAVYSNSSFPKMGSATSTNYSWYTQPANGDTGTLYGEAVVFPPTVIVHENWFQQALNSTNGFASLANSWTDVQDPIILNTARLDARGVVSLGFRVKSLIDIFTSVNLNGGSLYLATEDGDVLIDGILNTRMVLSSNLVYFELLNPNGGVVAKVGSVTCQSMDGMPRASVLKFWETKYEFYCSPIEVLGVQSVFVLAIPYNGLESQIHRNINVTLGHFILMVFLVIVTIFIFVVLTVRAARKEMCLRAALIEQKEATQQAERKSMNKSLAFATANHDIRASLAGISGLIEMSLDEVDPESEVSVNLRQMKTCTKDLLGILNSILDTSKIEAGKMQLVEEHFELGQLLEDVVDMFYTLGIKKGVDVVLDIDEKSFPKFSHVKGDRGRLKQILSNLLSNAVKFTSEGYVSVRVSAEKPRSENSILASAQTKPMKYLLCLWFKNKNDEAYKDLESINPVQVDPKCVEFVFEVDDTGKGIPKEKQKSIFENYVQVKETDSVHEGTGLGLGIVQSLVRVMGGEILIVDKEVGERGTCFRFTVPLTLSEIDQQSAADTKEDDIESTGCGGVGYVSSESYQHLGLSIWHQSPKQDVSHVVLFIESAERQKVSQKLIESRGIKVTVVKHWEQLSTSLKKIKEKHSISWYSSSSRSDVTPSRNSSTRSKEIPLSAQDGTDQVPVPVPVQKKTNQRGIPNFMLLVIDANAGPFRELSRAVAEFRREFADTCTKVVWLDKPGVRSLHSQGLDEDKLPSSDVIMTKPFHGSHLKRVISFLPQFRNHAGKYEAGPSGTNATASRSKSVHAITEKNLPTIKQEGGEQSNETRPLSGKRTLVAEDDRVQLRITKSVLLKFGAQVESCNNGEEALELVSKSLSDQKKHRVPDSLPYDYIFMDCQMPEMDGAAATRRIREEEARYGVRIPIVGLTAHTDGADLSRMYKAGIDFHLNKPLRAHELLEAIFPSS